MSVYSRNRRKSKMEFYNDVVVLDDAIQELVDNQKWMPKRQTFKRAIPLLDLSGRLLEATCIANSIKPKNRKDYEARHRQQLLAIGLSESLLLRFQQTALHVKSIPSSQKKRITKLCVDAQEFLNRWTQSDEDRYKNLK